MARVQIPTSRARLRRRRRMLIFAGACACALIVLFALFAAALHIPAIRISRVEVTGVETLASSTIEQAVDKEIGGSYLWVLPQDSIFIYPQKSIERDLLARYPMIANIDVHAVDFHTVAVHIVEREPRALYCGTALGGGNCYFMDEHGVIYQEAPDFSAPTYVQYYGAAQGSQLPRQFLTPAQFGALAALTDAITLKLSSTTVSGVLVDSNLDVHMVYGGGFTLLLTLHEQSGDIFERLDLALGAEPFVSHPLSDFEYLDLRFGDKLYYKLKK